MATSTIYSVPRPLYDIYPNDLLSQDHQISVNDGSNIDSGESFYPMSDNGVQAPAFAYPLSFQKPDNLSYFQPQVGLPPTFSANGATYNGEMASTFANNVVTYDWGMVPTFPTNGVMYNGGLPPTFQSYTGLPPSQTPAPSLITASSSASTSSSLQHTFSPLPAPLVCKGAQKVNTKSKEKGKRATRNATQSVKRKLLTGQPKRKRGPNKRPGGTSFSELLGNLPREVREALEEYKGCCGSVNTKDISTRQKHLFSNRHCSNLSKEFQEHIPNFVCPSFVALNKQCRSRAGRYDSTDRHCRDCVGFREIRSLNKDAHPVVVTRVQYGALQTLRKAMEDNETMEQVTNQVIDQVVDVVRRMLEIVFKDGLPVINQGESNVSQPGAIAENAGAPPPPTADHSDPPPLFEPVGVDDWSFDQICVPGFLY